MVSSHMKQSYMDNESHQFADKHLLQVYSSGQPSPSVGIPPYRSIPEKLPLADTGVEEFFSQSQGEEWLVGDSTTELLATAEQEFRSRRSECHPEDEHGSISNLAWITSSAQEDIIRSEHTKRPPTVDESHKHAYKRARQVDYGDQKLSFEFSCVSGAPEEPPISDAASKELRIDRGAFHVDPSEIACSSTSHLSWVSWSTGEEGRSELPIQVSFSPSFVEYNHQSSGFIQTEDMYLSILDYYPRKHVLLGLDHQADIPAWNPQPQKRTEEVPSFNLHCVTDEDNDEKFMGTCIIPMPDYASVSLEDSEVTIRRSDCICADGRSFRCVKQHVTEARVNLMETLGQAKCVELGFYEMGECVAKKWTEEEEQTFYAVVSANPASLSKNFWDCLPHFLPSKTSKDLVSYYFNVFMLRKRAEQNRLDPVNIDSDNDEWEESDDGEFVTEDCEGDSVVESPLYQDDIYDNDRHEEGDFHEEDDDGDACDASAAAVENHDQEHYVVSKGQSVPKSSFVPRTQPKAVDLQDAGEDDIQDDSCTSYEGQHNGVHQDAGTPALAEFSRVGKDHRETRGGCSPCDGKAWDVSYLSEQEKGLDFL